MSNEIQKAGLWKRIAAWLFDGILWGVLVVACCLLLSWLLGYDGYNATLESAYDRYEAAYGMEFDITQAEYQAMTQTQRLNYDAAYAALTADEAAMRAYNMMLSLSLVVATLGILLGYLIWEFFIPLRLGNGQTLGKKIFGLCLVREDGVKLTTLQLFVRTVLGKYTIETMVPVCIGLMLFWGTMDLTGTLILLALLLAQLGCLAFTRNNSAIHDLLAATVVADLESQTIFRTTEDLIAWQKQVAADRAARSPY